MKRPNYFINSVEKVFTVLNTFTNVKPSISLTELAKTSRMTLGTAHRYLLTLKELGYVVQNTEDKKYRVTPKVLSIGFSALRSMDLRTRVLPYMIQMTKERDVNTQCTILEGIEIVYIERVRSSNVINVDLTVGSRLPAYCTATGKAILAFMDNGESCQRIDQMNLLPLTPYTITNRRALLEDLRLTRERGYAISNQELTLGFRNLAVPIFKEGKVEAALGISFPIYRTEANDLESVYAKEILEIAKKVSIE